MKNPKVNPSSKISVAIESFTQKVLFCNTQPKSSESQLLRHTGALYTPRNSISDIALVVSDLN